jgi:hypothetical protein
MTKRPENVDCIRPGESLEDWVQRIVDRAPEPSDSLIAKLRRLLAPAPEEPK